jgi:Fe2+ transport system protein FeoA
MAEPLLTCPLCGFEFAPSDTSCHHGCPFQSACSLTRCPLCEYEFPATPKGLSWLQGWLQGWRQRRRAARTALAAQAARKTPGCVSAAVCADREGGLLTVRELAGGDRAEVVHLEAEDEGRSNALAVFGLVPGSEVTLVQRLPSYVLQVGETMLALDAEVAGSIVVRRPAA